MTGTILPTIERAYHLSYSSVSLLFVSYCVGYLITAFASGKIIRKYVFVGLIAELLANTLHADGDLEMFLLDQVFS